MQQTDKYKLNLIEKTDAFSPDALNENAQKVENALKAKAGAAETGQQFADLAARLTTLEGKKIAIGSYVGNGAKQQAIELPFAPLFLVAQMRGGSGAYIVTPNSPLMDNYGAETAWLDGATLYVKADVTGVLNTSNKQYIFLGFPQ